MRHGTGIRQRSALADVSVNIAGVARQVTFACVQGTYAGRTYRRATLWGNRVFSGLLGVTDRAGKASHGCAGPLSRRTDCATSRNIHIGISLHREFACGLMKRSSCEEL